MDKLKNKRIHLKGSATRLENFINNITNETSLFEIRGRMEQLEKIFESFQIIELEMVTLDEGTTTELEEFETRYYRLKAKYSEVIESRLHAPSFGEDHMNSTTVNAYGTNVMHKFLESQSALLDKLSSIQSAESTNIGINSSRSNVEVRLPKLNIPIFEGEYMEFKSFYDLFTSSIHNNLSLTAAQKFQYLKGLLKGEPFMLVKHLNVSDSNYEEALNKLRERYDKPSIVVDSLIKTFFNIPKVSRQQDLRKLSNVADEVIRGLRAQGAKAEERDPWLIHILLQKIDRDAHQAWAEHTNKVEFPSVENFISFINSRCDALERLPYLQKVEGNLPKSKVGKSYAGTMQKCCPSCHENHHLSYCDNFLKLPVPQRREFIKLKRLCFNCLRPGHNSQGCTSTNKCQFCGLPHHSSIHYGGDVQPGRSGMSTLVARSQEEEELSDQLQSLDQDSTTIQLAATSEVKEFNMLLPTATIMVKDNVGCFQRCNVLLDSGCQNTLISEKCIQRLGIPRLPSKIFVSGLGNIKAGATKGFVKLQTKSCYDTQSITCLAHVFKNLTTRLPQTKIHFKYWDDIKSIPLADPRFDTPKEIDIIIGNDYFFNLISDGKIVKGEQLIAQNSIFGYIICAVNLEPNRQTLCHSLTMDKMDLDKTVRLFWELENVPKSIRTLPLEDQYVEDFYKTSTVRKESYSVRLPLIKNAELGESYKGALRRLQFLERKFNRNKELYTAYSEFMEDYLSSNHMRLIPDHEVHKPLGKVYYLPHHAVFKENSLTSKLRVVFDGSFKTSNGKSLNDNMEKGPILHQDLLAVILRYRCKRYCFSADIKQMFRMIGVQEVDQDYQRILWRTDPSDVVKHYRLTTVTYGTRSAPFLAIRTLLQLAEDEKDRYPEASDAVKTCFYVDDCMAGADTIEGAQELSRQLNNLLMAGGFQLRKWVANDSKVLQYIPSENKIERLVKIPSELMISLLGVIWDPISDCFSYKVREECSNINTKRKLLSEISKIFDPLGWISPAIIAIKIILQQLWILKLEWDDELPPTIINKVRSLFLELPLLNQVKIPRFISVAEKCTYHGFCDASSLAYGAVIYCRTQSSDGQVNTNIIISKTKVAPIATVSIPRLELSAAYLLTQLFEYLIDVMNIPMEAITCWTDSNTVLAWLSSHPSKWKTFISNRTSYIIETLPKVSWRYVPTKSNPADASSRGLSVTNLLQSTSWFNGPSWLLKNKNDWPSRDIGNDVTNEEAKMVANVSLISDKFHPIDTICERISRWRKLVRVTATCIRYVTNLKQKSKNAFFLTVEELITAETHIYKHFQAKEFSESIDSLKNGNGSIKNKRLKRLSPFLDPSGVLRVGGRLVNANLPYDSKHQIILHKNSPIIVKIVREQHQTNLHSGITLTLATLRQKYWIIGIRDVVKSVIHNCPTCIKFAAKANEQLMGDLPRYRVNAAFPFYEVGCDYAGPILYKQHFGRKSPICKAYVAVFICLVTKAVHLELVSDQTTDAFLAALDRFVARRGLCGHIHSDNGTNFQGAARKLAEYKQTAAQSDWNDKISNYLSSKKIQWHFIPPGAPHFGGAWESAVKSMKFHLKRTIGQATLNFEQLVTLLARIEAILNSRPLVQGESDDQPYISPGHFICGRPLNAVPEHECTHLKLSTLANWRLIQHLTQSFWVRWSAEYLLSLQSKSKWLTEKPNISVNDVVLIREENLPPACWKLGKVLQVHAGSDGLVRVITLKTETSIMKRPITKVIPLPKDG